MFELELIIQPDEDEPDAASVFVDGNLNGTPYRFLLDTGAARSSVIVDEVTAALPTVGSHENAGVFNTSSEAVVQIERLEIGLMVRSNFAIRRSPAVPGVRSLIGMDILHDFCCHFQFDQNRLVIDPESSPVIVFQPLFMDKTFHPYVDVQFDTILGSAVWDTGASLTVVDSNFIQNHPDFFTPDGFSLGTDATGSQVETPMYLMSSTHLGGYLFPPQRVAAVDLSQVNARIERPMDLILGYMTLRKANWVFDFPRKRWAISKWLA